MAKKPKAGASSRVSKTPAVAPGPSLADFHPAWRFGRVDHEGPWGWNSATAGQLQQILQFLKEMERLTWRQVWAQQAGGNRRRGQKHKFIPMADCVQDAQRRLRSLGLEEYSSDWFRFRLMAEQRLWGIIRDGCFMPVWWDPDHTVCPGQDR